MRSFLFIAFSLIWLPPFLGLDAYVPVDYPNGVKLAWKEEDGFKAFHLIAEPIHTEFAQGISVNCWGYNGQTPGPMIEAVEGDHVRIYVTNHLPEATTVHWHGLLVPNAMDGVVGLTQPPIHPGETYRYEFTLNQNGTFMYHPHCDEMIQLGMGLVGFFVIHPKNSEDPTIDRDFALMLQQWYIPPGGSEPDPNMMSNSNYFTFNGKVFPGTDPLVVAQGQNVRIRIGNLSLDSHPIHLHGYLFTITGTGVAKIPKSAQYQDVTINVPVGNVREIEFMANAPGDWALHCHKTHHLMNGMGHDLPNMIGLNLNDLEPKIQKYIPGYMNMGETGMLHMFEMSHHIQRPHNFAPFGAPGPFGTMDMGGMFTVLKVREGITSYGDPGWYQHPSH